MFEDYSLNMFLRQFWRDERLSFVGKHNKSLNLNSMRQRLWTPDLYFINEKAGNFHTVTTPNLLLRLDPDGSIMFSQNYVGSEMLV
ncbi:unnamed protein product [Protopolystoma xenopodis]|uniref:Neurotransmitter-gated ion-channel ligand-binding domain-containing protein n=1 Tax=Protopolystoma xenopodis TaxID=117903 RepID=A0A3S5ALG4_9PLAT|nr:unnamed protein product [Protopolystoma xenopodis]